MADVTIFPKHGQPPIENKDKVVYQARKPNPRPLTERPVEPETPPSQVELEASAPEAPAEDPVEAPAEVPAEAPAEAATTEVANFKETSETPESD